MQSIIHDNILHYSSGKPAAKKKKKNSDRHYKQYPILQETANKTFPKKV